MGVPRSPIGTPIRTRPATWSARGRVALRVLAGAYLLGVWLDGSGSGIPASILPRAANYFVQVSALFPWAATASIDYRAEGFICSEGAWMELDTRPYFPIDTEDKENRFNRVMHFFRENRPTMTALDSYLVNQHNSAMREDGIPSDRAIGGVRLLSLRIPIPAPGDRLQRMSRQPLSSYPEEQRKAFYHTPRSRLAERCGRHVEGTD
jgi:hypothetical protein